MSRTEQQRLSAALTGRYAVEAELGQGGMAVVYRAVDLKHDRRVAIKVLRPEVAHALGPERFLREIKLTAQLAHPHILPLLDSGEADGLLYYVMPFVAGESLRDRLRREGHIPLEQALALAREVADALASAHRHGVIHRDIKPENILLEEGHAVVADFGIARAIVQSGGGDRLTLTGLAVGTPVYMSPEQRTGSDALDGRSDVYALACVVHETLSGRLPFGGAIAPEIPPDIERALRRALAPDPAQRFATVGEFAAALVPPRTSAADLGAVARLARRPRYALPAAALLAVAFLAILIPGRSRAARDRARGLVPQAAALADSGRWSDAYELVIEAERALGEDSSVVRLLPRVADLLTVTSDPPGADVYVQRFVRDSGDRSSDSVLLGTTPIRERRMARADYRVVVIKDGFVPIEALATRDYARYRALYPRQVPSVAIHARLFPADSAPADMVFVPGGIYKLVGPDMPIGLEAQLDDYFIDKYEVSNERYKAFVAADGYRRPEHRLRLTDRTGMPGPRSWAGQEYPVGRGRHPVTDVTWEEAAAYCAFVRKTLPTIFQWEKAARNGLTASGEGVMMPWGYTGPGDPTSLRANYSSTGTAPVDAYPFGISPFGAYNLAGNVKEWTANPLRDGYGVIGGSWADPLYLYSGYGALSPTASAAGVGFRCVRVPHPSSGDQGAFRVRLETRTPRYTAVAAAAFPALLAHYRYDQRPLKAQVVETVETPDWVRHKVRYVALEGDTALAYLYLPHRAARPLQTIVFVPSTQAFQTRSIAIEVERVIGPNIKAGRAALAVVFRGMAERAFGPEWEPPAPPSVRFRDLMVLHATELRRGLDYLATRDDIDMRRLGYVGVSWGAGSRIGFAAVDDRFRAVVLIGGGIDERVQPTLPEAANFNFAPYIRAPKLLLNGADDEEHPWFTRGLPLWNLLREPKELMLVPGAGHIPALEIRVPAINRFLDHHFGPVARNDARRQPD